MSAFTITMKQEQIAQSFVVINTYAADASAAEMVAHHRAVVARLQAEIADLTKVEAIKAHGAANVISTGCRGEWMVIAGERDQYGRTIEGTRLSGTMSKRNAEKEARRLNKMA